MGGGDDDFAGPGDDGWLSCLPSSSDLLLSLGADKGLEVQEEHDDADVGVGGEKS